MLVLEPRSNGDAMSYDEAYDVRNDEYRVQITTWFNLDGRIKTSLHLRSTNVL